MVSTTYKYAIYRSGAYLGLLKNITSLFTYNQTIGTVGAQIQISVGQIIDVAPLPITPIQDEAGNIITDETGDPLLPERTPDSVGDLNSQALVRTDNDIIVTEFSSYYPNGRVVFSGYISKWKGTFGEGSEDVVVTCISNGQDLANYLIPGSNSNFVDQSQPTHTDDGFFTSPAGQNFVIGTGVTNISVVEVRIGVSATVPLTLSLLNSALVSRQSWVPTQTVLGTASIVATNQGTDYSTYQFIFPAPIPVTAGTVLSWIINDNTGNVTETVWQLEINDASQSYTAGQSFIAALVGGTPEWIPVTGGSYYFKTYYSLLTTSTSFTSTDPSTIMTSLLNTYIAAGGSVAIQAGGYALTGVSATYSFKLNSMLEGIQQTAQLGPSTWYWYVDPATNILYYKKASTTADVMLIKGKHINTLDIEATKENIVNNVYFSGGDDGSGLGTTIFTHVTDPVSIVNNRVGLARISDNRVTSTTGGVTTAKLLAQNYINSNNAETYITNIVLLSTTIDISKFALGKMVGFSGFGNFVDTLLLQVVGYQPQGDQVTLQLGTLPTQTSGVVQQVLNQLNDIQTIDNPNSPS